MPSTDFTVRQTQNPASPPWLCIIKAGLVDDPIYGGAFNLVREIESCDGIYVLETKEHPEVAMEIIKVAEKAMLGLYDDFAFSEREINIIISKLGNLKGKGGK